MAVVVAAPRDEEEAPSWRVGGAVVDLPWRCIAFRAEMDTVRRLIRRPRGGIMAEKASHWPLSASPWISLLQHLPWSGPPLPACPTVVASPLAGKETLVTTQLRP